MRVAFAPDATRVLTASTDGTARITKIPFSRYLGDGVQLIGHTAPVRDCTFSRDAALVATASADRTVRVWRAGGETCFTISTQICQPSRAASVAVTAGAAASATAAADLVADNAPFAAECTGVRFFYQDKFVLLASGNRLSLFKYAIDVDSAERDLKRLQSRCKYRLVYAHQAQGVQSVTAFDAINAFSSSLIVCATSTRAVDVIDACVSKTVRRIADAHARPVHTVRMNAGSSYTSVSDDERHLFLTAAADSCIKLWDLRVAACVRRFEGHTNRQQGVGVSFSPCMRWIAAGSEDKAAHLFDIGTGAPFAKCVGHTDVVSDVAFSPLHPQLVTSCFDKQLRFFSDAK
jgi:WD40 repeat protein